MSRGKPLEHKKVLDAIKGTGGIISTIAKKLNCNWATARKYIQKWEDTQGAYDDERETILDLAESAVFQSIKGGNTQDAKWVLATLGKKRGFTERHEITGADNEPIKLEIKYVD